ncbi:retrovirus-related Pol polyprotein from transposon 17.6 [Trichonephila clavipes]|nr:retrovirus-related Pol polyprotein from transposon 17.6 [Trichonephila clavipes]
MKTWIGPATIIEITRPYSAKVELDDGGIRELHFNKLRPYIAKSGTSWLDLRSRLRFRGPSLCSNRYGCIIYGDVTDHISSDCQELDDVQRLELLNTLGKFSSLFSSLPGLAKVKGHNLKLKPDFTPKKMHPYRIPIALQQEVDRQINELLHLKLIEPSESEWAHPIVCVSKKNGSIRLCVDYRHLNSFTIADAYPMQNAKDLLFEVGQANYITVLDLTKGYWQIPMAEEAKPYTAFVTHHGHYQFCVMPFGMKNAGSTFQKVMDQVLVKHRAYCRSYIDDVAVFSKTWEQHMKHLCVVFQTIQKVGFTINLKKCNFARRRVKFLGHVVGSGNIPQIPESCRTSFYKIKGTTGKSTIFLYTPDLSKPYQLYTDASATAIGACLSQNDEKGKENPIAFFSKKLTETQTRWATIEREAYAVIEALKRFDSWIFGAEIEVISDHNPLTYLTLTTPQSAKLTRWALASKDIILLFHTGRALNMEMLMHYPGCLFPLVK